MEPLVFIGIAGLLWLASRSKPSAAPADTFVGPPAPAVVVGTSAAGGSGSGSGGASDLQKAGQIIGTIAAGGALVAKGAGIVSGIITAAGGGAEAATISTAAEVANEAALAGTGAGEAAGGGVAAAGEVSAGAVVGAGAIAAGFLLGSWGILTDDPTNWEYYMKTGYVSDHQRELQQQADAAAAAQSKPRTADEIARDEAAIAAIMAANPGWTRSDATNYLLNNILPATQVIVGSGEDLKNMETR